MATVSSSPPSIPESGLAPRPVEHPDTIQDAAATPDQEMPYRELGLKDEEYASIKELLGRRPPTPSSPCTRSCGPSTAPTRAPRST